MTRTLPIIPVLSVHQSKESPSLALTRIGDSHIEAGHQLAADLLTGGFMCVTQAERDRLNALAVFLTNSGDAVLDVVDDMKPEPMRRRAGWALLAWARPARWAL